MELKTIKSVFLTREFRRIYCFGISVLFFSFGVSVHAGTKTGADFLKIPIGAEAAGLGQAYSALSEGVNALNWNPAGLANQPSFLAAPSMGITLSHQEQLVDTSLDQFGLLAPVAGNRWTAGFSVVRLSYGDQQRRADDRQKTGSFSAYDLSIGAALARNFGQMQLGTQVKMVRMELAGYDAQGFALDVGAISQIPNSRFTVGAAARNLGPKMKFVNEEFNLPLTLSLGTAFRVTGPLSVSCDLQSRPRQNQVELAIGSQFIASRSVALRAGYLAKVAEAIDNNQKSETNRGNFGGIGGLAAGLGIHFNQFSIDYAITPFGELGNSHALTLTSWFGGNRAPQRAIEIEPEKPADPEKEINPAPTTEEDRDILILPPEDKSWWDHLGK